MKRVYVFGLVLSAFCMAALAADAPQRPASVGQILDSQISMVEHELVPLIEAMPADKFDFAPSQGEFKGVRTFAQQAKHIIANVWGPSSSLLGEKDPTNSGENGPDDVKTKDQIVKYAKDAFANAHKAAATITNDNATQQIDTPWGSKSSRLGLASMMVWHSFDHYGQMVVYARMNGVVPPASRQQ